MSDFYDKEAMYLGQISDLIAEKHLARVLIVQMREALKPFVEDSFGEVCIDPTCGNDVCTANRTLTAAEAWLKENP